MPTKPTAPAVEGVKAEWLGCGIGCGLVMVVLLLIGGVTSVVQHVVQHIGSGPATVTMPNFAGKDCKASQAAVDQLFQKRKGVYQDDKMATDSPSICAGNVVIRTDPRAGATVDLKASDTIQTRWWAIEPVAYHWYKKHRRMPNFIGKIYQDDGDAADDPTAGYISEVPDYSLVQVTDSGWYEQAAHKIVRTSPAPGAHLAIGQKITFYTQVQRGKWVPYSGGSSGNTHGGGGGIDVRGCAGTWWFHVCF